jgi:hypothetical protein
MYEAHEVFSTLHDHDVLWRYMDFKKLASLL